MTPSSLPVDQRKRGSSTLAFVVATGFALATAAGAALSATGTGALQKAVHVVGFGHPAEIATEQRQQAATIAKLEDDLRTVIGEIAGLKSRETGSAADPATDGRLARLETSLARVWTQTAELRTALGEAVAREPWRRHVDDLKVSLAQAHIEIGTLRSSIDERDETHHKLITDVSKRVDRLESLIATDLTGSIPSGSSRRSRRTLSGWSVQDAHNGGATIKGDGGKFDVTRGTLVPGLGRVTNVRQRGSRWIVVTDKGTIVQR